MNVPNYNPPIELLETGGNPRNSKEPDDDLHWNRRLSKYKGIDHDPKWVYAYVLDDLGNPFACVIYDRFAKGFIHLLILPVTLGKTEQPKDFKRRHLRILGPIHRLAERIAFGLQRKYDIPPLMLGYHALPSMADLHMHIISSDLVSDNLKRKEHYNSFTNPNYFLTPEKIENDLNDYGKVQILPRNDLKSQLSKTPLRCHICGLGNFKFRELKVHLNEHIGI